MTKADPRHQIRAGGRDRASLGWCETHRKVLFLTRKGARKVRRNGSELSAYRCDVVPGFWHLGHLPIHVKRGVGERLR